MIDFTNFHNTTVARFTACEAPDREPDFVSRGSGSAYWDTGDGVIRKSDHWSGQNGCFDQRSCKWSIDVDGAFREDLTGYCAYGDFEARKSAPIWHHVTDADRELAARLKDNGGAIPASDWVHGRSKRHVPAWSREDERKYDGLWADNRAVKRLFSKTGALKAISSKSDFAQKIRNGAKRIKIGEEYV